MSSVSELVNSADLTGSRTAVVPRNTNIAQRVRVWTFTLNNYVEDDIKRFMNVDGEYTFQEETGENGTPHLQGVLKFRNAKTLSALKKIFGVRAHFEPCRNLLASIQYCSKEETRTGNIYSNMEEVNHELKIEDNRTFDEKLKDEINGNKEHIAKCFWLYREYPETLKKVDRNMYDEIDLLMKFDMRI